MRHGPGGCPLCSRARGPSRSLRSKRTLLAGGGAALLVATGLLLSLSGGAPEPTETPGATATAPNPASPGGSVAESQQLQAMELSLDQLASLIDTAEFAFRSMPESIDTLDDQADFRAFNQDFERQLSLHLDVPPFPQNGPDWLQKIFFRVRDLETQVRRLRFINSYPSAGARESLVGRCREYHRRAVETLEKAKDELSGESSLIRRPRGR
jgi:hypothetical protein